MPNLYIQSTANGFLCYFQLWAVQNYIAISILSPSVHARVFLVCTRAGGAEVQVYGFQVYQVPFWRIDQFMLRPTMPTVYYFGVI